MSCIERTIESLCGWLGSSNGRHARRAIDDTGVDALVASSWLKRVTEDPSSGALVSLLVRDARRLASRGDPNVDVERWLLTCQALDTLAGSGIVRLGPAACRLTCEEFEGLLGDDDEMRAALDVSSTRFRELAKLVTGRRFSAGLFHWDECGVRRSWLAKVPPRDWIRLAGLFAKTVGLRRMMYPHLNPRYRLRHLEESDISACYRVVAESLARRRDLRGLFAASWLWSPDTHRVSPRLAAVNRPIVEHGGFVTTLGLAPLDSGVFEGSATRRRLFQQGEFIPTIGLMVWPRDAMLRWAEGAATRALPAAAL